jgi:hypothetical protein
MPTRQATAVILAAARALGADADPSAWSADLRRDGRRPQSLDDAALQITELARRVELAMLPRDGTMLDALVAAESLPLVVLPTRARAGATGRGRAGAPRARRHRWCSSAATRRGRAASNARAATPSRVEVPVAAWRALFGAVFGRRRCACSSR